MPNDIGGAITRLWMLMAVSALVCGCTQTERLRVHVRNEATTQPAAHFIVAATSPYPSVALTNRDGVAELHLLRNRFHGLIVRSPEGVGMVGERVKFPEGHDWQNVARTFDGLQYEVRAEWVTSD